jgi:hypothetical protein
MIPHPLTKNLYDTDFLLWLETTATLLRERQLDAIDYDNLIEEIEAMGRSEKNSLQSNLTILLLHLLKWEYQPNKRSSSWVFTMVEHHLRIIRTQEESPTLQRYLEEIFPKCYADAVRFASKETGLPLKTFPAKCPFPIDRVLDFDSLPQWGERE